MHRVCTWLLIVSAVLLWQQGLAGQEATPAPAASEPATPAAAPATAPAAPAPETPAPKGVVQEVGPQVIYLWDKDKQLVAIPGMTVEDFRKYYRLMHELERPESRPRYGIGDVSVTGAVNAGQAELTIRVHVTVSDAQWVRVPLRLDGIFLKKTLQYQGEGEHFLEFAGGEEGYVLWLRGEPDSEHDVTLEGVAQVVAALGESRLRLTLPRATTAQLAVSAPGASIEATAEGASPPTVEAQTDGRSQITALGLAGPVLLTWREASAPAAQVPVVLDATSSIFSKLDGRTTHSEATITVRSFGGEFDRFRVKLPPGAQLVSGREAGYTLASDPATGEVEVRLDRMTTGPRDVRLVTEQVYDVTAEDAWIELAGFEVLGAVRQYGHLAVAIVGDWQAVWGDMTRVRQVDELPESLRGKDVVAGFELLGQPSSLKARVVPRIARVTVEPEYMVLVDAGQVRLEARCRYQVRGGNVAALAIDVGDWEITEVGPAKTVSPQAWKKEGSLLAVPLLGTTTGEIELWLRGHRPLDEDKSQLTFPLPRPTADAVSPATVVVSPADNVELIPRPEQMAGLSRYSGATQVKVPQRQQDPLVYWGESGASSFAASMRVLPQEVSAEVQSHVELLSESIKVEQKFTYYIANEPAQRLLLEAPATVVGDGALELRLGGQVLPPSIVVQEGTPAGEAPTSEVVTLQVMLPKSQIGNCELTAAYTLPHRRFLPRTSAPVDVPLVMPMDVKLLKNEVSVAAASPTHVEPRGDAWRPIESDATGQSTKPLSRFSAATATTQLVLAVHLDEQTNQSSTIIEKSWLQTWISESARYDRAVYRVSTAESSLRIRLPRGVEPSNIGLSVDGREVAAETLSTGEVLVPLAPRSGVDSHLVDLRYFLPERGSRRGDLSLELPTIQTKNWTRRQYWQLILPRDEHVVMSPRGVSGEFAWGWNGWYWGRRPILNQAELESWLDVPPEQGPPGSANTYLYSSLGQPLQLRLQTTSRVLLVFVASFVALSVGLSLIYVPLFRHPAVLLLGIIVLVASGSVYPELVILIAQAASLGIALTMLAGLLQHSATRRRSRGTVVRSAPSSILDRGRLAPTANYRHAVSSSASSATVPIALDIGAGDGAP